MSSKEDVSVGADDQAQRDAIAEASFWICVEERAERPLPPIDARGGVPAEGSGVLDHYRPSAVGVGGSHLIGH